MDGISGTVPTDTDNTKTTEVVTTDSFSDKDQIANDEEEKNGIHSAANNFITIEVNQLSPVMLGKVKDRSKPTYDVETKFDSYDMTKSVSDNTIENDSDGWTNSFSRDSTDSEFSFFVNKSVPNIEKLYNMYDSDDSNEQVTVL